MSEQVFAASPGDIKYGGYSLRRSAELVEEAKEELDGIVVHQSWHGNHDQISQALEKFYTPALLGGQAALGTLFSLLSLHGDNVVTSGQFLGDLNSGIADFVGGGRKS